jgi:serine/threonine-protein kinase
MIGGRFRVEGPLAQDGVSRTYRAIDTTQGAPAAVRIIPLRVLGAEARTLEAEVEKASAILHKNLVTILMAGREADFYFVATELMDGQSLRDFMDGKRADGRGISFKGACNLLSHIANGLDKASPVMAHGGLNPASIWVNKAGRVKVADLGLTRTLPALGRRGAPAGSPDHLYLAPEVLAGAPPSAAADVFSLGVILYEVLAGGPPSGQLTPVSNIAPDVPPAVDGVIERALNRHPQGRWASAIELKQALSAVLNGAAGTVPATAPAARAQPAPAPPAAYPAAGPGLIPGAPLAASQPPVVGDGGRLTLGTPFNVMAVAGGVGDDTQERWLVQKDKLDFGPFSLAQIKAQIERGEILGEHLIVDSDSGERTRVKEFPGLGEFTKLSERRREQLRRAHAERASESTEKKKSMATFFIGGVAVLGVLGVVGFFVMSRKESEGGKLASRQEGAEVDAFLKDVKINFATAHVAKRGGPRHGSSGGASNDAEFNNDAVMGDATKSGVGDETLDDDVIQKVMMGNYRSLVPCIMQERHKSPGVSEIALDFVVRGNGKVSAVKVNGQRGGPFASCVMGRMQGFGFPKFNGGKTIASWSMSMR